MFAQLPHTAQLIRAYRRVKSVLLLLILLSSSAFAVGIEVPALHSPVHDQAGLFNPQQKQNLITLLYRIDHETDVQMAILTVDSLQGESIEQASIRVVDQWQLGGSKSDKGLLLLIAKQERKVRIEVGQGLEGDIPDAYSKRIIDQQVLPSFKQGLFYEGVMQALQRLCSLSLSSAQVEALFQGQNVKAQKSTDKNGNSWFLIILWMAIILLKIFFSRHRYAQGYDGRNGYHGSGMNRWGGGSSGGGGFGGFSGGGGGFSGGGSSGSW